ncbi:DUF2188 domain-containing protein [Streptomonospora sp. PA3]|uniref:DUF2188 domain-containing protein n=1 Tax=Streptomonospora sp. PA3 TaxID=2607326 RepID=UPI0012DE7233|nr:DUF2188 domain-containing protein [Streptomonospora sp. PA3]MUL43169.1 DUF2188 domain-containing protein [Streptomonospora sp. PA3]
MARNIYWAVPSGSQWQVKHEQRVLSTHPTKDKAVEEGQRVAKANQPSQLRVMRADGTFEYEYTYGSDPFPPVG